MPTAKDIMARAERSGCEIVLADRRGGGEELKPGVAWSVCAVDDVPPDAMILDFGPDSLADLKRRLGAIRTVLWNGPLGAFETAPFGEATFAACPRGRPPDQGGQAASASPAAATPSGP